MAKGMPMIVMANRSAESKCPRASQRPAKMNQRTLPMREPVRGCDFFTIIAPERPEAEPSELECLHSERDTDDGDEHQQAGNYVGNGHPESAQDEPQDVPDEAEGAPWLSRWLRRHDRDLSASLEIRCRGDSLRQRIIIPRVDASLVQSDSLRPLRSWLTPSRFLRMTPFGTSGPADRRAVHLLRRNVKWAQMD